jgi:cell division GTPase FtsZ
MQANLEAANTDGQALENSKAEQKQQLLALQQKVGRRL